jgi:RNA polymerase sigma factor (sigma-70 family)
MPSRPAYFECLLKFLRRKGRSREDAEDLIQEAMLRLHVYCQEKTVVNEEAFLRQAVHNLAIDQYRRDRPDLGRETPIEELRFHHHLVSPDPTPEQLVESRQQLEQIGALLDAVNPRTREIYFAHRSGYSYAEIAEHLGIAVITIERHIARALLVIMEHRAANDGEGEGEVATG